MQKLLFLCLAFGLYLPCLQAQKNILNASDASAPLHALTPDYTTAYRLDSTEEIWNKAQQVMQYLKLVTPNRLVDAKGKDWTVQDVYGAHIQFSKGDFRPISYEWGVTYHGFLEWNRLRPQANTNAYVFQALDLMALALPAAQAYEQANPQGKHILKGLVQPRALDDIGAMAMAFLKAKNAGYSGQLNPILAQAETFILHKEHRLEDRTLVRIRPLPNTLWLDDLYMSIPALLQLGKAKSDSTFFKEALFQYRQYKRRMFVPEKGLFMHGYLEGASAHPAFHWARANGWALLTLAEMLEHFPAQHPARPELLEQLRAHLAGLMALQDKSGFWHQLLDKNDSYLETSATAIYTYVLAKGINQGWLDPRIYGPAACLAWQAIKTKVNAQGQVEGTCVGTGLAWDPAFYYHRPISPFAAHGYGPFLLAASAMYELMQQHTFELNDSAIHWKARKNK